MPQYFLITGLGSYYGSEPFCRLNLNYRYQAIERLYLQVPNT